MHSIQQTSVCAFESDVIDHDMDTYFSKEWVNGTYLSQIYTVHRRYYLSPTALVRLVNQSYSCREASSHTIFRNKRSKHYASKTAFYAWICILQHIISMVCALIYLI